MLDDQESRLFPRCNQAIKAKFQRSKFLIPVASVSTGSMKMTTPCSMLGVMHYISNALPRVYNIYTEESILLSYTPVEGHIMKL